MKVAPLGAFGAMAFTIGAYGVGTLLSLAKLMACFYATCVVFIFVVLGLIARAHGFGIWKFIKYIKEELFIVLGTSSSESVLPRMIAKLENLGVQKSVVGLVIPAGYSFNLDGTAIYLTMAAVFIAQATNTPLDLTQQLTLLFVLLLTSKGASGVTGSGFIVLAATLSAVGNVPVAGVALILGVDRFMSEARALTNLIGNGVATVVVAKWCSALDTKRMHHHLDAETVAEAEDPEQVLVEEEEGGALAPAARSQPQLRNSAASGRIRSCFFRRACPPRCFSPMRTRKSLRRHSSPATRRPRPGPAAAFSSPHRIDGPTRHELNPCR
jgi:aerobic C4-dicarboxylate transport protein